MEIVNRAGVDLATVQSVAERSGIANRDFVLFLDGEANAVRADHARRKLDEYRVKGWNPLKGWAEDATEDSDHHACTVNRRTISTQKLPAYVIEAIGSFDLLVYLDAVWTKAPEMDFVLTLAHELRHAWQFFNCPVVFHSQTALAWVVPPQLTPCELDAEKAGKRMVRDICGEDALRAYLSEKVATCKPEHRETTVRLAGLDSIADSAIEAKTIALLEEHAQEIRRYQAEGRKTIPGYVMPGVPELMQVLRGKTTVQLLP